MYWSSIRSGIQPGYELEPGLGLCRYYNLVVDLLQEATYFFAALLKSDSDSGVNRAEKKNLRWGTPCKILVFFLQLAKLIKYKKTSVREPLEKLRVLY